jgi:predicted DNA-binding transcriptional regulator YafY
MPPLVFTPEDLGTSLVGEMWGQLYQEAAQGALAKLDNLLPDEQRQEVGWARRSLVATGLLRAGLEGQVSTLEKLRRGVRELRRVHMVYQSSSRPEVKARKLDPYGLVHRWGWWYVIGYCHLRLAVRLFRIDRIRELALTDEAFTQPAGFDVREYLETEFQDQPQVRARMRFIPQGAFVARDGHLSWDSWEEQTDGSVIVTFRSPDLNWAASTVLAYGPLVEVLEPPELRQTVQEWATAVVSSYDHA